MALNKIMLQGRFTADPEMKKTAAGKDFINFNIAVNRNYKNKDGVYPTDFFKVLASGTTAAFVGKYFHKGDEIIVVGSLATSSWEDKNGNKRLDTYIEANEVHFGAKRTNGTESAEPVIDSEFFEEISGEVLPF